ncbi:MAG TPA: hypothetical protein VK174_13320 [Chitinophagales bacterium]|nr:hypothetical protein [Chitinophagales bacterium]
MKQKLTAIALLFLLLTLSGCFGVEEKILIHKDGSGEFTLSFDITQTTRKMVFLLEKMNTAMRKDSTSPTMRKEDLWEKAREDQMVKMNEKMPLKETCVILNGLKGISQSRHYTDTTNGKFAMGLTFKFTNIAALNKALKTVLGVKKDPTRLTFPAPVYTLKEGILIREVTKKDVATFLSDYSADDKLSKAMMKDFKYVVVVQSDNDIKAAAAGGASTTFAGKQATLNYKALENRDEIKNTNMHGEVQVY